MKIFKRRRLEHVEQRPTYPEPWFVSSRWWLWMLWRGLLGRPMDNVRWTNATFFRDATSGEASRWLRLAGWKRAAIRSGALYLLPLTIALTLLLLLGAERSALWIGALHGALLLAVLLPVLTARRVRSYGLALPVLTRSVEQHEGAELERHWRWERRVLVVGRLRWEQEKVLPVARLLRSALNLPASRLHPRELGEWLTVPRTYREHGSAPVSIVLPGDFNMRETARKQLVSNCAERLGMKDPVAQWELEGALPQLLLRAPVLPPDLVTPADMLPELEQAAPYTFVLGRSGAETLSASLREDSPHIAVSAGSGAGKSEMIKGMVAQALHWGWSVLILDWKGESQEWAELPTLLPGVRYVREVPKLHDAMISIGEEIEHRRLLRDKGLRDSLPRVLVVSEEWSITSTILSTYWTRLRADAEPEERRTMPLRSPAVEAGMMLNFAGRSLGFCQLMVAIRFSARVTNGNADMRESFGFVCMSRWKGQTVKMLAPDIRPFPKKITTPGRWVAVNGDTAVVFQAILWSDQEAREWSTSGVAPAASPWSVPGGGDVTQRRSQEAMDRSWLGNEVPSDATGHSRPAIALPAAPQPVLRSLVDLSTSLEYLGITKNVLRNAARSDSRGDPNFPKVKGGHPHNGGYLYDRTEVHEWAKKKRAAEAARKVTR